MMRPPSPYGRVFRAWRKGAGLTQQALADRLGVDQCLISAWETHPQPGMTLLRRWAEVTGMTLSEIVSKAEAEH